MLAVNVLCMLCMQHRQTRLQHRLLTLGVVWLLAALPAAAALLQIIRTATTGNPDL